MIEELKNSLPDLHSAEVSKDELVKTIDYTRPLDEYGTAEQIAEFVMGREKSHHIYTDSLNVNGIAIQDAMEKYLAASEYYNSSSLKEAFKSPLHLKFAKESGWAEELRKYQKNKKHFQLGTYLHMCVLEPTRFKRVCIEPKKSLSTKDGVDALIKFWENKIEISGTCFINGQEITAQQGFDSAYLAVKQMGLDINKMDGKKEYYQLLKTMSVFEAVSEEHKTIIDIAYINYKIYGGGILPELVKHSKREISLYYEDPDTGLKVRVRPDAMQFEENLGCNAIISVKTTRAESISHFAHQSAQLLYEISEGMYCEVASGVTGRDFNAVIMIMIQTVPPFGVAALVWDAEDIEIGKYKYRIALDVAKDCKEKDLYPGFDAHAESGHLGLIQFKQPSWNAKELLPIDLDN